MPRNNILKTSPSSSSSVDEYLTRSEVYFRQGDYQNARGLLEQALEVAEPTPSLLTNYGMVQAFCGDLDGAIRSHQRALQLLPDMPDALANLGTAFFHQGNLLLAEQTLHRALALQPRLPVAHVSLGLVNLSSGYVSRAERHFRAALQLDATLGEAWSNLGVALQEQGRYDDAQKAHARAVALRPTYTPAWSNFIMGTQYHPALGTSQLRDTASRWDAYFASAARPKATHHGSKPKIHIAYLSADFYSHPVGYFIRGVLPEHNHDVFRLHAYSTTARFDGISDEIRQAVDRWRDVRGANSATLASLMHEDSIDILVDLSGHTSGNLLPAINCRLAPVQLSWLGYFGTTGASNIDAVIIGSDQYPPGGQHFFTEPVRTLKRCQYTYVPPADAPEVSAPPSSRNPTFRFGSFNNTAKLNNDVIMTWCRILGRLPHSELILKWKTLIDPDFSAQVRNRFAQFGINPARLILRPASPHRDMLSEYSDVDVALDPFPFGGALTTCEALWMGVPVVSYAWQRPVSRQGLAILRAINRSDWVASTPDEYIDIACALATDSIGLQTIRTQMRDKLRRSSLFDYHGLCRELESIYLEFAGPIVSTTQQQGTGAPAY